MKLTIPVAHDFICPWCWVGILQAKRLELEFDIVFDWLGYELFPEELEWPDYAKSAVLPNTPQTLSRFEFLLNADGIEMPKVPRPKKMRTYNAHQAAEYAKSVGVGNQLIEEFYKALWLRGENINEIDTILKLAEGIVADLNALRVAVETKQFKDKVVGFDDEAYSKGVYNVPTFFIGSERYAEQPLSILRAAIKGELEKTNLDVYTDLEFATPAEERPYAYINMVTTIDGKILSGNRDESVLDLGSSTDHLLMKRLEQSADAIIIGAQTLRACPSTWKPAAPIRLVVSKSGNLPFDSGFFQGGESYVVAPFSSDIQPGNGVHVMHCGDDEVDFPRLFERLRNELGIEKLLILGGSELNAQLIRANLVDELFITIAPRVKLGRDVPTYADGEPLARESLQQYNLVESHTISNEIFIRYRRDRSEIAK